LSASAPNHARIPILYVILGVLLVISIVPMYFYSAQVEAINGDRLKTNEMLLQNTVTRSLADDLAQQERSLHMMLANLSSAIQVASGGEAGELLHEQAAITASGKRELANQLLVAGALAGGAFDAAKKLAVSH